MYSENLKNYLEALQKLQNSETLDDDEINEAEEMLEKLYYELDEEEILITETINLDDFDAEEM